MKENEAVLLGAISGQAEAPSKGAPYVVTSAMLHLQQEVGPHLGHSSLHFWL